MMNFLSFSRTTAAALASVALFDLAWQAQVNAFVTLTPPFAIKRTTTTRFSLASTSAEIEPWTRPKPSSGHRKEQKFKFRMKRTKHVTQPSTFQSTVVFEVEPPLTDAGPRGELYPAVGLRPPGDSSTALPWSSLRTGDILSGRVVKVLSYGVLVKTNFDIPGRHMGCALLHQTHLPDDLPLSSFKMGDIVENARIARIHRDQGSVYLSLRDPKAPWRLRSERSHYHKQRKLSTKVSSLESDTLSIGQVIENARVVKIVPYGAFVDIGHPSGRHALLHVTRMSLYKVGDISKHVKVGQRVNARIIQLDQKSGNRIGDIAVSILSEENDAFVDRRQLQMKRMKLWRQVVRGTNGIDQIQNDSTVADETETARAKRELLQVDRQLWDLLSEYMDTPKTMEV